MAIQNKETEHSLVPADTMHDLATSKNGQVDSREHDSTDAKQRAAMLLEDEQTYVLGTRTYADQIAPESFKIESDRVVVDGTRHVKTGFIYEQPESEDVGTYEDTYSQAGVTAVLGIKPINPDVSIRDLERRQAQYISMNRARQAHNLPPDSNLTDGLEQTTSLLADLKRNREKSFSVANYLRIEALGDRALEMAVKKIELALKTIGQRMMVPRNRQDVGYDSTGLLAADELKIRRNIHTKFLAAKYPFSTKRMVMEHGVLYGETEGEPSSPVLLDNWDPSFNNANAMVIGTGGVGKTTALAIWALRQIATYGRQVFVVDPAVQSKEGFRFPCVVAGGSYVKFGHNTRATINILEMPPYNPKDEDSLNPYAEQIEYVPEILKYLIQELMEGKNVARPFSPDELVVIKRGLRRMYSRFEIYEKQPENFHRVRMPLLTDLLYDLQALASGRDEELSYRQDMGTRYQEIANYQLGRLEESLQTATGKMLTAHTNVKLDSDMVVFSVGSLPEPQIPMGYLISNRLLWNVVRSSQGEKIAITDEAQQTLGDAQEETGKETQRKFMTTLSEDGRKHGLGLWIATQRYGNLTSTETGRKLANNSNMKVLMPQEHLGRAELPYEFSDEENALLQAGPDSKGRGIVILGMGDEGRNRSMMHVGLSKYEKKITSNSLRDDVETDEDGEWMDEDLEAEAREALLSTDGFIPAID